MGTGLSDLPVCHHQNLVRILDDGQGMSNHYHGLFLFQQIGDGLFYRQLILNIQGCRTLFPERTEKTEPFEKNKEKRSGSP